MVTVREGDLVLSGGVEFHIKYSEDGNIQAWCDDTGETISEDFEMFIERCKQRGSIHIKPGEGKFGEDTEWEGREEYKELAP